MVLRANLKMFFVTLQQYAHNTSMIFAALDALLPAFR
jgi:hypothetical protein